MRTIQDYPLNTQRIEECEPMENKNKDGKKYEKVVEEILTNYSKHKFEVQYSHHTLPDGTKQIPDILLTELDEILSLKTQTVSGTVDQKIAHELSILQDTVEAGNASKATIVLHGDGWNPKVKSSYMDPNHRFRKVCPDVDVIVHDEFLRRYTTKEVVDRKDGLDKFYDT